MQQVKDKAEALFYDFFPKGVRRSSLCSRFTIYKQKGQPDTLSSELKHLKFYGTSSKLKTIITVLRNDCNFH